VFGGGLLVVPFILLKNSWKHDKIKRCYIHFALTHERCILYGCGINARTRAKAIAPVHINHPYVNSPVAPLTVLITIVMTAPVDAPAVLANPVTAPTSLK
jgi:hypothetical protein